VQQTGFITHEVVKVYSHDRYSIRIKNSSGTNIVATSTGLFGGTNIVGSRNVLFTAIHPTVNYNAPPNTSVTPYLYTTSGRSPHGNEVPFQKATNADIIFLNDNNYFDSQKTILNKYNESVKLGRAASMELHLELVARELYFEAFFGGKIADDVKVRVQKQLKRNIAAFGQIANFSPYIAGSEFTMADCAAIVHLPLIGMATKAIYGEDMMAAYPVRDYMKLVGERPTVKKVTEDRKVNAVELAERFKSKS
jgi:hypothetical protein